MGPEEPAAGPCLPLPAPASGPGLQVLLPTSALWPDAAPVLWQGLPVLPALQLLQGQ